ncbi:SCO family protein [Cryomorphaceae bacterium]|nr:SCO family protein [Cryomorphaceae bacterium]
MRKSNLHLNKSYLLGLGFLWILSACAPSGEKTSRVDQLPFYNEATFTPHWLSPSSAALDTFHKIAPFSFTDQNGLVVNEETVEGKIYVTDFFFTTCPGICPKMTANMTLVQEAFLDDPNVLILSHSVTPNKDSTEVLAAYASEHGVQSNKWLLLTGDRQEIYTMGREQYFVEEDLGLERSPNEFLHTENFVLIDQNRHIRGIYNGLNKGSVQQLIADIRTLKANG